VTSADVRDRLVHALRLDLIGPGPDEPQAAETLEVTPSRWYLAGFLVPWSAPARQKRHEGDTQGELGFAEAASGDVERASRRRASRRAPRPVPRAMAMAARRRRAEPGGVLRGPRATCGCCRDRRRACSVGLGSTGWGSGLRLAIPDVPPG
jgi:hypothetical protein